MLQKALKWTGTVGGIAGAFLLAANLPISGWGYVPFLAGSLAAGVSHCAEPPKPHLEPKMAKEETLD